MKLYWFEQNSTNLMKIKQKFYRIDQNWTKFNGKVGNSMLVNDSEQNFLSKLIPFNWFLGQTILILFKFS